MKLKIVFIALAFLLPTVFVRADDGLTQCFDYYKFGSVQVDIAPVTKDALSGTNIVFKGNVRNTNAYPIVDGAVYIKVFRKAAQSNVQANGWELVDQFFAKKDITIDGTKQYPITFTWKAPAHAVSGEYKLATYFVTQDRYNLSGLSFTDDITGTIVPFKITGEQTKAVFFDKSSVKVGGQNYMFAAFTPKVGKVEPVDVVFSLKNEFTTAKDAQVSYTLYSWDGLSQDKLIASKKESISLKAGEVKQLSYTVTDANHPVYYLVVESKVNDSKSIINVRFARQGIEEARLNFPALNTYPLKQGATATMFSCFHNSGLGQSIDNGKVVMTLTDGKGKTIDTYTYTGKITGAMMAVKKDFVPTKDITSAILTSQIFVNDTLVETSRTHYECDKINPEVCAVEAANTVGETSRSMMYIVIALAVLVLIVAILAYHGHMKRKDVGVAALLFASTLGMGMVQVQAKLVSADILGNATSTPTLTYPARNAQGTYIYNATDNNYALTLKANTDIGLTDAQKTKTIEVEKCAKSCFETTITVKSDTAGYINVDSFVFQYTYGAEMRNAVTEQVIPEGSVIPQGTKVKFVPVAFNNNHIAWFLSGSTLDSPYAYWDNGDPVPTCSPSDKFARQRFSNGDELFYPRDASGVALFRAYNKTRLYNGEPSFDLNMTSYLPMVVKKPNVNVDLDQAKTTANVTKNSDGTYTVNSQGVIAGTVTFAPTTGTAYFQYSIQNFLNKGIKPMMINGVFIDIAPGQDNVVNSIPQGACQTFTSFTFPLEQKQITLSADVAQPVNKAPNTPTLYIDGTCINNQTNIKIGPATPVDPDAGDTVTYEYQIDYGQGAGYGPTQTTSNLGAGVTFGIAGQKKVRLRAKDSGGLVSAWTEKSFYTSQCATVRVACSDPVLNSSFYPQWTATVFDPTNKGYTVTWQGPQSTPTAVSGQNDTVLTYTRALASGSSIQGPTVTATVGADSDSIQCPTATRGGGGTTISGSCTVDSFTKYIPTWKAVMNGGSGNQTVKWYKGNSLLNGQTSPYYTNPTALNIDETINDIYAEITASNGGTGKMLCSSATRSANTTPSVDLVLTDLAGNRSKTIKVTQGASAFASTFTNAVANCIAQKSKVGGGLVNSAWGTADFEDYSGPSKVGLRSLQDYPLNTSEVGQFELKIECNDTSTPVKKISSAATLIVTKNPNLEEI